MYPRIIKVPLTPKNCFASINFRYCPYYFCEKILALDFSFKCCALSKQGSWALFWPIVKKGYSVKNSAIFLVTVVTSKNNTRIRHKESYLFQFLFVSRVNGTELKLNYGYQISSIFIGSPDKGYQFIRNVSTIKRVKTFLQL